MLHLYCVFISLVKLVCNPKIKNPYGILFHTLLRIVSKSCTTYIDRFFEEGVKGYLFSYVCIDISKTIRFTASDQVLVSGHIYL